MLLTKASVLAVMLMALGFIARVVLFQSRAQGIGNFPRYPTLYLPLIGGFCVVPCLTMRLRSQIAGVVFTASIPGMKDRPRAAGRRHHLRHRNGCRQGAGPRRLDTGDVDLRPGRGRPVCAIVPCVCRTLRVGERNCACRDGSQ